MKLENSLKLNHGSFGDAINKMLEEIEHAEIFLREEGNKLLQNVSILKILLFIVRDKMFW